MIQGWKVRITTKLFDSGNYVFKRVGDSHACDLLPTSRMILDAKILSQGFDKIMALAGYVISIYKNDN